jgi:hypothetical protein
MHERAHVDRLALCHLAAGLDARQAQHLIDEREQVLCARLDSRELRVLHLRDRTRNPVGEELLVSDDRGERRAELVAHHSQERRLRVVRGLGLLTQILLAKRTKQQTLVDLPKILD